jgi:BirA family transcriptional regulator, biotin operon repressor / biotin---[acetyl-CoA-carboxylase] ligase
MDQNNLQTSLAALPLSEIKYFDTIGSTNEYALNWAKSGAADGCLVVANTQTAGRGRLGRKWITSPDSSLAFSLIIHPQPEEARVLPLFSPLGSLAVAETLVQQYAMDKIRVKWPNDVLIDQKKTAGILVESSWLGSKAQVVVIGIGINVAPESIPPADQLLFPATCVENSYGKPIDRIELLSRILKSMLAWRAKITTNEFLTAWDNYLAFRGEMVHVQQTEQWSVAGELLGIDKYGNLRIRTGQGGVLSVAFGDVHLRPIQKQ